MWQSQISKILKFSTYWNILVCTGTNRYRPQQNSTLHLITLHLPSCSCKSPQNAWLGQFSLYSSSSKSSPQSGHPGICGFLGDSQPVGLRWHLKNSWGGVYKQSAKRTSFTYCYIPFCQILSRCTGFQMPFCLPAWVVHCHCHVTSQFQVWLWYHSLN